MRRAIRQAVEADADFIAIPSGDTVLSYGMGGKADGIHYAYDTMYPKNLRNILQRMDKSVQGEKVDHIYSPVDGSVPERSKGHTLPAHRGRESPGEAARLAAVRLRAWWRRSDIRTALHPARGGRRSAETLLR